MSLPIITTPDDVIQIIDYLKLKPLGQPLMKLKV